jgi:PIN domain nuclease of toxin-antitoxin system
VTLLADTSALIVFHGYGGQTMSHPGKAAMSTGDVFVCPITVWEISRKIAQGKLERAGPPASTAVCRRGCVSGRLSRPAHDLGRL